ncbi:MAG: hypothetical protein K2P94_05160 [Rhodospirillaceae bacterium]|nr:hypothetical protein [Rhodospirillaceae bacterium]
MNRKSARTYESGHESLAHEPREPKRGEISLILTLVFIAGAAVMTMLTLGGVHALVQLVTSAANFKASIVAGVLGLGLVVLGPVLLLALAVLLPRWWLRDMKHRIASVFRARA